jgi:hypothetical protein
VKKGLPTIADVLAWQRARQEKEAEELEEAVSELVSDRKPPPEAPKPPVCGDTERKRRLELGLPMDYSKSVETLERERLAEEIKAMREGGI